MRLKFLNTSCKQKFTISIYNLRLRVLLANYDYIKTIFNLQQAQKSLKKAERLRYITIVIVHRLLRAFFNGFQFACVVEVNAELLDVT